MSSQTNPFVEGTGVVVKAVLDKTKPLVEVALGGKLRFENHFPEYPDFEIEFDSPGPPSVTGTLTGTVQKPIVVQMPDVEHTFSYHIVYKKEDGTSKRDHGVFHARSCGGCPSNG
jgi:hypothetical protein